MQITGGSVHFRPSWVSQNQTIHLIANWRRETVSPASNIKHVYCQLMSRHCFCLTTGVNMKSWGSISSNVLRSTPKALQYLNLLPQVTTEISMDKIHPAATVWPGLAGRAYKPKVILNDWRWTGLIIFLFITQLCHQFAQQVQQMPWSKIQQRFPFAKREPSRGQLRSRRLIDVSRLPNLQLSTPHCKAWLTNLSCSQNRETA